MEPSSTKRVIRYYGSCGILTGYGQAANEMVSALQVAGAEVEIAVLAPEGAEIRFDKSTSHLEAAIRSPGDLSRNPAVVIIHTTPNDASKLLRKIKNVSSKHYVENKPLYVVYTTWEGASAPPESIYAALEEFDQIWLPSTWNQRAFMDGAACAADPPGFINKLHVIPHAFDEETLAERRKLPLRDSLDDKFRFYYIGHWAVRKNPQGLIAAFARAFDKRDNVELVLHSRGASDSAAFMMVMTTGIEVRENLPPITLTTGDLPTCDLWDLHRKCDCFVTATRGEAWNLPAFDAVLAGRYVISTGGIGSDDFLRGTNAKLIAGRLAPTLDEIVVDRVDKDGMAKFKVWGSDGCSVKTDWIDPDLRELADVMRLVYEDRRRHLEVGYDLLATFGRKAVGKKAMSAIMTAL